MTAADVVILILAAAAVAGESPGLYGGVGTAKAAAQVAPAAATAIPAQAARKKARDKNSPS